MIKNTIKRAPDILTDYIRHIASEELPEDQKQDQELMEDFCEDVKRDIRRGVLETNIACDYSRNYETKSVAMHIDNFNGFTGYIGWTYWYGGGKHSNPDEIDWIEDAYFLDLIEEKEVITVVRIFKKR